MGAGLAHEGRSGSGHCSGKKRGLARAPLAQCSAGSSEPLRLSTAGCVLVLARKYVPYACFGLFGIIFMQVGPRWAGDSFRGSLGAG